MCPTVHDTGNKVPPLVHEHFRMQAAFGVNGGIIPAQQHKFIFNFSYLNCMTWPKLESGKERQQTNYKASPAKSDSQNKENKQRRRTHPGSILQLNATLLSKACAGNGWIESCAQELVMPSDAMTTSPQLDLDLLPASRRSRCACRRSSGRASGARAESTEDRNVGEDSYGHVAQQ